jgi:predicted dehydrogenase
MVENSLIIGLGNIGLGYDLILESKDSVLTHSKSFSLHPSFNIIGAVDPNEESRERFEEHYLRPAFPTVEKALELVNASVVAISSPTSDHFSSIKKVLNLSRPKAILCEKPLAFNLVEARTIVDLCNESSVNLFVNYIRRADPGVIEIKRRITSGQIETPIKGIVWYSKGLLNNGSHFLNLIEFWLGSIIETKILSKGRMWDENDPEPDLQVIFERGTVIFIAAWEEFFSHYTVELLSPSGRLRYDDGGKLIIWQSASSEGHKSSSKSLRPKQEIIFNDMSRYQLNVLDQLDWAMKGQPTTLTTGREALIMQNTIHEIINQRLYEVR